MENYKTELNQTKVALDRQEKALLLLAKTSEAAFEEHAELKNEYKKESYEKVTAITLAQNVSGG